MTLPLRSRADSAVLTRSLVPVKLPLGSCAAGGAERRNTSSFTFATDRNCEVVRGRTQAPLMSDGESSQDADEQPRRRSGDRATNVA